VVARVESKKLVSESVFCLKSEAVDSDLEQATRGECLKMPSLVQPQPIGQQRRASRCTTKKNKL